MTSHSDLEPLPPPPTVTESAAILAQALAMERAHVRRSPREAHAINDTIRGKRCRAHSARQWMARWGDCEASWMLAALAAELDRAADDLEATL